MIFPHIIIVAVAIISVNGDIKVDKGPILSLPPPVRLPPDSRTTPKPVVSVTPPKASQEPSLQEALQDSHLEFTLDLYRRISNATKTGKSVVFSPFSVYNVLLMTFLGAQGETSQEICRAIRACELNDTFVHTTVGEMYSEIRKNPDLKGALSLNNRVFVEKTFSLSAVYEFALGYYYSTEVERVDFSKSPELAGVIINDWVEKATNGLIRNLFASPPDILTQAIFTSVITLQIEWRYKFDPTMTLSEGKFYLSPDSSIKVPMMIEKLRVHYAKSDIFNASIIELPYKVPRLSMFVILPDEIDGLPQVERMLNATTLKELMTEMKRQEVNVRLPKFSLEEEPALNDVLRDMGVKKAFDESSAEFNRIAGPLKSMAMPRVVHKALIKVDEAGTVAAAATAQILERIGDASLTYFECDHPFMFLVMDKQSGMVLFAGKVVSFEH